MLELGQEVAVWDSKAFSLFVLVHQLTRNALIECLKSNSMIFTKMSKIIIQNKFVFWLSNHNCQSLTSTNLVYKCIRNTCFNRQIQTCTCKSRIQQTIPGRITQMNQTNIYAYVCECVHACLYIYIYFTNSIQETHLDCIRVYQYKLSLTMTNGICWQACHLQTQHRHSFSLQVHKS